MLNQGLSLFSDNVIFNVRASLQKHLGNSLLFLIMRDQLPGDF